MGGWLVGLFFLLTYPVAFWLTGAATLGGIYQGTFGVIVTQNPCHGFLIGFLSAAAYGGVAAVPMILLGWLAFRSLVPAIVPFTVSLLALAILCAFSMAECSGWFPFSVSDSTGGGLLSLVGVVFLVLSAIMYVGGLQTLFGPPDDGAAPEL